MPVSVVYHPSRVVDEIVSWGDEAGQVFAEAAYGASIVTQRCVGCGWHDSTRHAGRVAIPGVDTVEATFSRSNPT